jgi:hypothetical protein
MTTVATTNLSPIPNNMPLADKQSGMITQVWSLFFEELYQRTGGAQSSSNSQLANSVNALLTAFPTTAPQNFVIAGPSAGGSGQVAARRLVVGDIPILNQNTTGNAATASSLNGGSIGAIPYQGAVGVTAFLAPGTATWFLQSQGPGLPPVWAQVNNISAAKLFAFYPNSQANYWNAATIGSAYLDYGSTGVIPAPSVLGTSMGFPAPSLPAGSLPGFTFMAPSTGNLKMSIRALINQNGANIGQALQLIETVTATVLDFASVLNNANAAWIELSGTMAVIAGTVYTVVLQVALANGGPAYIGNQQYLAAQSPCLRGGFEYVA